MRTIAIAVFSMLAASAATAGDVQRLCYETVDCVQDRNISSHDAEKLGCDQLWTVRNGIFAARGYCFQTERGRQEFSNDGCRYADQDAVPLNDYERANIRVIQAIEKRRGC